MPLHCLRFGDEGRVSRAGQRASTYGDRITAIVVYLSAFQFMPLDRLATLMIDLFGVNLSRATIETMSRRAGERLLSFADAVRQLILLAPVKHSTKLDFASSKR